MPTRAILELEAAAADRTDDDLSDGVADKDSENCETPIRMKLLETGQQTINCQVTVLEALQCGRRRLLLIRSV
jgi:hypothetical protein